MRLIDAEAFERRCMFDEKINDMQDVIYALRDFPTIESRTIGKWMQHKQSLQVSQTAVNYITYYECSECGAETEVARRYCAWCGALMEV